MVIISIFTFRPGHARSRGEKRRSSRERRHDGGSPLIYMQKHMVQDQSHDAGFVRGTCEF